MKILLKKVMVADPHSTHNGTVKDIFITNGNVEAIGNNLSVQAGHVVEGDSKMMVSPGWTDVFSQFSDPGSEHKETLESGAAAAATGGYTQVFVVPNTAPVIYNKAQVKYIVQKSRDLPVSVRPLGAVTKNCEGKELAEMYDMYSSGAVAFTDGLQPIQSSDIMLKALLYVKTFEGVIIQVPVDKNIHDGGLMHEGLVSTRLGLPGIPSVGEELLIKRDLSLLQYTGSRLHFTGVSTGKSIELIRAAKQEGLSVTCSATPYHLYFCDDDLQGYNTNLKVNPPLRTKADREALRAAVRDGTIDCIATHHIPQHWDDKTCEFEFAKNGMIGLQTSFAVLNTLFPDLANDRLVELFSINARKIFHLSPAAIQEGEPAEMTLFARDENSVLTKENSQSKSSNTPFLNAPMQGLVKGIICKNTIYF